MKKIICVVLIASATFLHAEGTIMFANTLGSRFQINGAFVIPAQVISFGVFVNGSETPVFPLGVSSPTAAGMIVAPSLYPIWGFDPLQVVSMQIKGWEGTFASYDAARAGGGIYGATDVRQVTLGPTIGPGTVIWQPLTGTLPNRFYRIMMIPEPSIMALGILSGVLLLLWRRWFNALVLTPATEKQHAAEAKHT